DQSRHHAALHRVALEEVDRAQRHLLAEPPLQVAPDELRHQHLIFEAADLQAGLLVQNAIQYAADAGDHGFLRRAPSDSSSGTGRRPARRRRRAARAASAASAPSRWRAASAPWSLSRV